MIRACLSFRMLLLFTGLLLLVMGSVLAQEDLIQEIIRSRVEEIRLSGGLAIGEAQIASVTVVPDLYERRNFRPAWTNPNAANDLIRAIEEIEKDGLDPNDYNLAQLKRLRARAAASDPPDPEEIAEFDLLLTDSFTRLGYHIIFGKVDPEDLHAHWNLAREIDDIDPVEAIQDAIDSSSLAEVIEDRKPQHTVYKGLRQALAQYRAMQAAGGWEPVPEGPALKKGMADERVVALRRRLAVTGDLVDKASNPGLFDEPLKEAVIRFQARHRLAQDGVVGRNTIATLNVPVAERIDQIRVNLERARWVLHELTDRDRLVIVDIAGFEVFFFENGRITWTCRAQVGRPYRKTPVFKSDMKYMVFNPTWTVPPGILAKDILPAVKRDPNYLRDRNISVIDPNGQVINQNSIDWSNYTARSFPYQLRQEPGANNALGRIKFIFPNQHFVFLHDTPSRSLFERTDRAFSSGCIRVEKPFELAVLLLNDQTKWPLDKVTQAISSRKTRTVFLSKPMPVLLYYWTARLKEDGTIIFKKDIYKRDKAVLEALEGEFKFRKRPVAGRSRL